jgi:hypothetical protein
MNKNIFLALAFGSLVVTIALWLDGVYCSVEPRLDVVLVATALAFISVLLMSCRGFSWFGKVLLVYLSLGLSVVAGDIVMRTALASTFYYRDHERLIQPIPGYRDLTRYRPLVSSLAPSSGDLAAMMGDAKRALSRQVSFQTDDLGFRNEPGYRKEPVDVLIAGDSFAMGSGTTQTAIWPQVLRDHFRISTYNLSVPGGPWTHLMNVKLFLPQINVRPNAVLLLCLYTGNDLDDDCRSELDPGLLRQNSLWERTMSRIAFLQQRNLITRAFIARRTLASKTLVLSRPLMSQTPMLFFGENGRAAQRSLAEVIAHPNCSRLASVLDEFQRVAATNGMSLRVALFPCKEEVYAWAVNRPPFQYLINRPSGFSLWLEDYCRRATVPYLDLRSSFEAQAKADYADGKKLLWWWDDTHINERGHELAASLIAPFLRREPGRNGR